ncbi:MAG TPA: TonB-dependent receptor [Rhodanobacteraceae bacterium]
MRLDSSELSKAVKAALSLSAVAAVGVAGTAFAQQATTTQNTKQPQTLQTVVVTGSHIRSVDLETDNPIVTVSAKQIEATGKLTIGAVIDKLPVITGGLETPSVNNGGGSGKTQIGLRGLGASRTLILVDGQRVINNDLNSIPTAAVQQIQVLTSGASAIYGSDAIGGVVNIILKSNYQGAQFTGSYGISDHNDGERKGASFMFGQTSDKGSILAGVSYQQQDEVLQSARKFSANAYSYSTTANGGPTKVIGGSTYALRDFISVSPALSQKFGCPAGGTLSLNQSAFNAGTSPTTASDYHCYSKAGGDAYNFAAVNLLMTPQERTNGFFKGVYHLSDNVDFFATLYHNKTSSTAQLAPAVFGTPTVAGTVISKDSYYNPFGVNFNAQTGGLYRVRMVPSGNRVATDGSTTSQLMTGFRGSLNVMGQNWQWDVGMDYGHTSATSTQSGYPNSNELVPGLGPSFLNADGVVQCGTAATPISLSTCTPWNGFNLNSASAKAAIAGATAPSLIESWAIERIYHADANGGIFNLPAGTAQLAVGVSYRKEYQNDVVGPLILINPTTLTCTLGSGCSGHTQGGFNVKEAYAELFVPILKDVPFVHELNLTLADRYSKYSDFGSTSNWKVGLVWRPINDLMLRGTVSKVFRAPTIGNLFAPPGSSAPFLASDPCDFAGAGANPNAGNPACKGVPATGPFKDKDTPNVQQLNAINESAATSGFPLGPEKGKSFDFGVVYSPHFVPGLSLSADLWRIYLNNTIGLVGAQSVVNLCAAGNTVYCPFIERVQSGANAGQLIHLIQPIANLGRVDVKGVDFSGNYRLPAFSFGQFTLGLNTTYLTQMKIQTAPGEPGNAVFNGAGLMGWFGSGLNSVCPFAAGGMCFFPRVKAVGTLDWQLGPWSAGWTMRYYSHFREAPGQPAAWADIVGVGRYGSYVYSDLNVGYDIQPLNTKVSVGVDNVFDKQPPLIGGNFSLNANTDTSDFDVLGRYYWARVTVSF